MTLALDNEEYQLQVEFYPINTGIIMSDRVAGELVQLRSDVLYLIRVVEKLEKKITQLEDTVKKSEQKPQDPFAGMTIEKL